MSTNSQSPTKKRNTQALRIGLVLFVLLGAFVVGRSIGVSQIVGTWAGDSEDQVGRRMHMTATFGIGGKESLRIEFYSDPNQKPVPPPAVYRGTYFFEGGMLVQDLEATHAIPEGMFYDRPLHETKVPTRELRCVWKVDGDRLYMNARTPVDVILTRVR